MVDFYAETLYCCEYITIFAQKFKYTTQNDRANNTAQFSLL